MSASACPEQNAEKSIQEPEPEESVPTAGTEATEQGEETAAPDIAGEESMTSDEDSICEQENEVEEQEQATVIRSRRIRRNVRFCAGIAAACLVTLVIFWGVTKGVAMQEHPDAEEVAYQEEKSREEGQELPVVVPDTSTEPENQKEQTAEKDLGNDTFPADGKETDTVSSGSQNGGTDEKSSQSSSKNEGISGGQTDAVLPDAPSAAGSTGARPSDTGTASIAPTETPKPSHIHNWIQQYKTVHHDAVTQQVWIVDQAAWDEPVYEERPVYETYGVNVCNVCGTELFTSQELNAHGETHIDWETMTNPFSYHYEERQRQVGTETVQVGTAHHEEVGHWETQIVAAAYDEQVPNGYLCSGCGATK